MWQLQLNVLAQRKLEENEDCQSLVFTFHQTVYKVEIKAQLANMSHLITDTRLMFKCFHVKQYHKYEFGNEIYGMVQNGTYIISVIKSDSKFDMYQHKTDYKNKA